jgi:hypothetical protein
MEPLTNKALWLATHGHAGSNVAFSVSFDDRCFMAKWETARVSGLAQWDMNSATLIAPAGAL